MSKVRVDSTFFKKKKKKIRETTHQTPTGANLLR